MVGSIVDVGDEKSRFSHQPPSFSLVVMLMAGDKERLRHFERCLWVLFLSVLRFQDCSVIAAEKSRMYYVVEFDGGRGGDIGIVHEKWLTPKKKETHWPPYKLATRFHKSLMNGEVPDEEKDEWELFPIRRIFYNTDDILKAREKEKQAVIESDVHSCNDVGENERQKRKRKPTHKLLRSSNDDDSSDSDCYPKTYIHSSSEKIIKATLPSPPTAHPEGAAGSSSVDNNVDDIPLSDTVILSENSFNSDVSNKSSRSHDIVLSNVCRHLTTIKQEIKEIREIQTELLAFLKPNESSAILTDIKLPCQTSEDVGKLEEWLTILADNKMKLEHILSTVGGRKVDHVTRRILEKLFTNRLALQYNWTGKNGKISLKGLHLITTIKSAVRANRTTINASDDEIEATIKNWFRFSKDRDGGRENRRQCPNQTGSSN